MTKMDFYFNFPVTLVRCLVLFQAEFLNYNVIVYFNHYFTDFGRRAGFP